MEINARKWLDGISTAKPDSGRFGPVSLSGLHVWYAKHGCVICFLRIPAFATDNDGLWQPGSIATLIDLVGAAAILSAESTIKVSVDFVISYFSPVKLNEEVDIDARVIECKGKLTMVVVEIIKKQRTSRYRDTMDGIFSGSTF
ncbi:hypothetical protein LUZ60_013330 [Juncus effusus]|nr:hypothetical protein LUZ60_013330 [Juncus effusus]